MRYSFDEQCTPRDAFRKCYPTLKGVRRLYVYALKSKTSDTIRYVGVTNNPVKRLAHHRLDGKTTPKHMWIQRTGKDAVCMQILTLTDFENAYVIERDLVNLLIAKGRPPLNSQWGCGAIKPSKYNSDAERQKAYRERKKKEKQDEKEILQNNERS